MSITRLAVPVTFFVLLTGAACGGSRTAATSEAPPVTSTSVETVAGPTRATSTSVTTVTPAPADERELTDVDRSLDELDRELQDVDQSLAQTQEGDVDQ